MSRAVDETGVVCRTHVGGQALLEGIMMRGKYNWALAVRKPDGSMHLEEHDLESGKDKNTWMYKPVVRGCTAMVESLMLGYKALEIAAQYAFEGLEEDENPDKEKSGELGQKEKSAGFEEILESDEAKQVLESDGAGVLLESDAAEQVEGHAQVEGSTNLEGSDESGLLINTSESVDDSASYTPRHAKQSDKPEAPTKTAKHAKTKKVEKQEAAERSGSSIPKPVMTGTMIVGMLLGIAIFVVLPAVLTNLIVGSYDERTLLWNIVDGVLRVIIFIFYIWLIGRMSDIKRMFAYHGAEHKTIHCYEHGLDLTIANARRFPTLHVRCGTAFLLTTMIIAILVFTIVPVQLLIGLLSLNSFLSLVLVILTRILLLPFVAGLSYEVTVKWAGSRPENPLVRIVLWPGLQMQRLTTNEPDDGMIQCAIEAMLCILHREEKEAADQRIAREATKQHIAREVAEQKAARPDDELEVAGQEVVLEAEPA
ncbi:MAG: DUF1385 domain-containing protein [Coriobacteriia bacterium]|nr:DUF1385 domain-containing protein [Coriobacteriia bacterium]